MKKILNDSQAKDIYSAMVTLNNVFARAHVRIDAESGLTLHVRQNEDDSIHVFFRDKTGNRYGDQFEEFETQNDFAIAYGVS